MVIVGALQAGTFPSLRGRNQPIDHFQLECNAPADVKKDGESLVSAEGALGAEQMHKPKLCLSACPVVA
jgi:hypothetical protein